MSKRGKEEEERGDILIQKRTQVILGDLTFVLKAPRRISRNKKKKKLKKSYCRIQKPFRASSCTPDKHLSDESVDYVDYVINFTPPMLIDDAKRGTLEITYTGEKQSIGRIRLPLIPDGPSTQRVLGGFRYLVFPTHQLEVESNVVSKLYVRAENNLMYSGNALRVVLEPAVDMCSMLLGRQFGPRFVGLEFMPPDIDLAEHGITIAPRDIPQRTPQWARSQISGTKAYKLLGFFIPNTNIKWRYDEPEEFTLFQRCRMRFGTLAEDYCIMAYLKKYPARSFFEVGSCSPPQKLGYPATWGASADGRVRDPNMVWARVPAEIRKHYDNSRFDPTRGVVEFKASRKKESMEAYYYPQVYMEMIANDVVWCDVVRYCKTSCTNAQGKWCYTHKFRVYRVYRHKPTEDLIVKCIKYAAQNTNRLQEVVAEKEFRVLRDYFKQLANTAAYEVIEMDQDLKTAFEEYKRVRNSVARNGLAPIPLEDEDEEEDPTARMWKDIVVRFECMKDLFYDAAGGEQDEDNNNRAEFVHHASLQIAEYASLINTVLG